MTSPARLEGVEVQRAVTLALAALERVVETAPADPLAPSLAIRALLAFLFSQSNGDRQPYDEFWSAMRNPYSWETHESQRRYVRQTWGRIHWHRIATGIGLALNGPGIARIHKLTQQQREADDPEVRARRIFRQQLYNAALDHEIKASKGAPHSEAAKERMRAQGGKPRSTDGCGYL